MEQAEHSGEGWVVLRKVGLQGWAEMGDPLKGSASLGIVAYTFNPSRELIPEKGGRGRQICDFEASLVYIMCFRTARAM